MVRKRWTVRKRGIHGVSLRVCTGEWLKVIISYFQDPTRKEEGTISVFVNAVYGLSAQPNINVFGAKKQDFRWSIFANIFL